MDASLGRADSRLVLLPLPGALRVDAGKSLGGDDLLWVRSQDGILARVVELRPVLEALDVNPERAARTFFYDPAWTSPWFRRNELAIEVANDS